MYKILTFYQHLSSQTMSSYWHILRFYELACNGIPATKSQSLLQHFPKYFLAMRIFEPAIRTQDSK